MTDLGRITRLVHKIFPVLDTLQDDYCLIGSSALLLSGIEIPIHDVDILTSGQSAEKLKSYWIQKINTSYRPENPERFRSRFYRFDFEEIPLEVMGDLEVNQSDRWEKVVVKKVQSIVVGGKSVNIPTIEEQKRIFRMLGREKDLEKIKMFF